MEGGGSDDALRQPMDFAEAEKQRGDPVSLLNHYTRLLRIRNTYDALRRGVSHFVPSDDGAWDCKDCESNRLALIREWRGEKILVVHNFSADTRILRVDLSERSTGLDIPDETEVHALMGQGVHPPVSGANRSFYRLGAISGHGSKALFIGDVARYRDAAGKLLTYENAVPGWIERPDIPVGFTCENGQTVQGWSVYAVGSADAVGGNWNTSKAEKLEPTSYPTWTDVIDLPASSCVEWKCIVREEQGNPPKVIRWQPGPNNLICTPPTGTAAPSGSIRSDRSAVRHLQRPGFRSGCCRRAAIPAGHRTRGV